MPPGVTSTLSVSGVTLGADPAAGAEVSFTVPAGKTWFIRALSVVLVQGATQTPQPILIVDDGTNTVFESFGSTAAQSASSTCRYCWAPGLVVSGQVGTTPNIHSQGALPKDFYIGPGYRLRTTTLGIGANTDYGIPALYVVEYG